MRVWTHLGLLAVFFSGAILGSMLFPPHAASAEEAAASKPLAQMTVDEKLAVLAASALELNDDGTVKNGALFTDMNALWTCIAAFLVFFMQAGFAMVETGFTRAKNACNILMKNLLDFCIGTITFWILGFGLMFGANATGWFGTTNFLYDAGTNGFNWSFLIFQTVFCATSATIVSGAMAERTKFGSYLIYTAAITTFLYPIFGSWAWGGLFDGGGWLEKLGFHDFAGSTVVHSIGGWAALAGAIVLGPRIGKYKGDRINPIPGHNIPLAALGVFILWLGWFGFNPGSTTAVGGGSFAFIAVTTNMAAAAGALGALFCSWIFFKKPDPSFALNGTLAGLVAITAGCDVIPVHYAALTGLLAGILVVFACVFIDRIRIDDPVGAVSVHGICGAFGTLAVGLFAANGGLLNGGGPSLLITQAIGVGSAFLWSFILSMAIFLAIKYTVGLRVSAEEEIEGLDVTEHGMYAYPPSFVTGVPTSGEEMGRPLGAPVPAADLG